MHNEPTTYIHKNMHNLTWKHAYKPTTKQNLRAMSYITCKNCKLTRFLYRPGARGHACACTVLSCASTGADTGVHTCASCLRLFPWHKIWISVVRRDDKRYMCVGIGKAKLRSKKRGWSLVLKSCELLISFTLFDFTSLSRNIWLGLPTVAYVATC